MPGEDVLVMGDLADEQLETADKRYIGRVADVEAEWREDGTLVLTDLVVGPQALAGRVASWLRPVARVLLRDRFDHRIPLSDAEELAPTIRLRKPAAEYAVGQSERWLVKHIMRFIPGSGY